MPSWQIEQREAGNPAHGPLGWVAIGCLDAPDPSTALKEFCIAQQYYAHSISADHAVVHGVGHFRASLREDDPALGSFTIQLQDPIGPTDRHITWTDVAVVRASDAPSALGRYLETQGELNLGGIHGNVANLIGIGNVRAVASQQADELRMTRAPRLDEPLP